MGVVNVVRVKKTGRPKKYVGSDRVYKGIYIPYEMAKRFEQEAQRLGISFNHYINILLASSDRELAQELIEYYKEIREEIQKNAKELQNKIEPTNILKKIEKIEVPEEIEKDPELQESLKRAAQMIKSGRQHINQAVDWLIPVFEFVSIKNGYMPEGRAKIKMYLISRLKSILSP